MARVSDRVVQHQWPLHSFLHLTLGHIVISEDSDVCRSQSPSEHDCISLLTAPTLTKHLPGPTLHNTGWVAGPSPLTLPPLTRVNMYSSSQVLGVIRWQVVNRIPTKKQSVDQKTVPRIQRIKMPTFWITLSLSIPLGMKAFNYPGKCTLRLHFIPSSLSIFLANKTSILQEFYYRNNLPNFSLLPLYIRRLTSMDVEEVGEWIVQGLRMKLSNLQECWKRVRMNCFSIACGDFVQTSGR